MKALLQHDGRRLVTFTHPERRTIRVISMRVMFKNPFYPSVVLRTKGHWSDLRTVTGTLFFPDRIQTEHSQIQLQKEESLFFVEGMLMAPLVTAGVSYRCRLAHKRWKMRKNRCQSRPVSLKDPGNSDRIVLDQNSLTHFPSQPWCKV